MTADSSPALARFRLILWGLVLVAAVAATALFLLRPPASPLGVTGKPFTLTTTTGGTFTEQDLKGTPSLVFFGYTFCPDVCPTTLAETVVWKEALGIDAGDLRTIFITVDPERDTREVLADYLGGFDPQVIGLVGTPEQTEAAKAAFGAMSEKVESGDEYYLVNHTASVFLMNRDGTFQGTIAYGEAKDTAVAKIKRLIGG
ncbi:SCO family protein [Devosia sp.]|uniref:SCO family protein n=1 Tax=Devosia sp. TaxID=1871048 RepID=UPI002F0F4C03